MKPKWRDNEDKTTTVPYSFWIVVSCPECKSSDMVHVKEHITKRNCPECRTEVTILFEFSKFTWTWESTDGDIQTKVFSGEGVKVWDYQTKRVLVK